MLSLDPAGSNRPPPADETPLEPERSLAAAAGVGARNVNPDLVRRLAENSEVYAGWATLVGRIRSSQTDGMAELYHLFSKGVRFYLCRQLGVQDLDDRVHDTFVVVVQAIRRGELREPERHQTGTLFLSGTRLPKFSCKSQLKRPAPVFFCRVPQNGTWLVISAIETGSQ